VARLLIDRGYSNVRPLEGGFEAWLAAGVPTEELSVEEAALHPSVAR
jgi:rhodanese-related sulfurtransferase